MKKELFTLTSLTKYLNERYEKKKTGKPFTVADVQRYVERGYLPHYLGDVKIEQRSPKMSGTSFTVPKLTTKFYILIEKEDGLGK